MHQGPEKPMRWSMQKLAAWIRCSKGPSPRQLLWQQVVSKSLVGWPFPCREVRHFGARNQRKTSHGRNVRSASTAKSRVKLIRRPMWKVPKKEDEVKVRKPPQRIKLVTTMAFPVDKKLLFTAIGKDLPCPS